jgi:nicotinate dehydrogenase subunit A
MAIKLKVNGSSRTVTAEPDTPLLYVLRNDFGLNAAKFGCGLAQCGACTVLVDGKPMRSCMTEISDVDQSEIVTLEGLGTVEKPHPLQRAFIEEQAAQCGYCINGMVMQTAAFLASRPGNPSEREIRAELRDNLCRCGTHQRIIAAVKRAATLMGKGA